MSLATDYAGVGEAARFNRSGVSLLKHGFYDYSFLNQATTNVTQFI